MRECDYCLIHRYHGGNCEGKYSPHPCLMFEKDPLGCRRYLDNQKLPVPFGFDIPEINVPCTYYQISGVDKAITVTRIKRVEWQRTGVKGLRGIVMLADIMYWSDENGELPPAKPKLRLIKNER